MFSWMVGLELTAFPRFQYSVTMAIQGAAGLIKLILLSMPLGRRNQNQIQILDRPPPLREQLGAANRKKLFLFFTHAYFLKLYRFKNVC